MRSKTAGWIFILFANEFSLPYQRKSRLCHGYLYGSCDWRTAQ